MAESIVSVSAATWTQAIADASGTFRIQNYSQQTVLLKRASSAPSDTDGAIVVQPHSIITGYTLDQLWPGASGNAIYAYSDNGSAVSVSHA